MPSKRQSGTVKWFSERKGYGFIRTNDGEDVFVHFTDIEGDGYKTLKQDAEVSFEVGEGDKGLKAIAVRTE